MAEQLHPSGDTGEGKQNVPDFSYDDDLLLRHDGLMRVPDSPEHIPTGAFRTPLGYLGHANPYVQLESYNVSSYKLEGNTMYINDAVWGEMFIDGNNSDFDTLLMRLARSALFRRTQAIEQLTLGENFSTIPSTTLISRWSHIWGSLAFIRKMNEGRDIDPRESQTQQLRTLLSDVGHTAFSHLGDWMFQEAGSEDLHDRELKNILAVSGVRDILDEHGFTLEEVVFPDVKDWVECPSPDLNVDRVDYGLREMLRWQDSFTGVSRYQKSLRNPQSLFEIVDNNLVITDPNFATRFAVGYSLLPTEHWAQPVHRLQLQLLHIAMRRIITQKLSYGIGHPREAMYAVDNMFDIDFKSWDMMNLESIMKTLAQTQRRMYTQGRKADLDSIFLELQALSVRSDAQDYEFPEFPDPLKMYTWQSREFIVPHAPNLMVEPVESITVDPMTVTMNGLQIALPALKPRIVDPYILNQAGEMIRLSEYNPSYEPYLDGQRAEMTKNYLVTILTHPAFAQALIDKDAEAIKIWNELLQRPRDQKRLKEMIDESHFWGAARSFDDIREL